MYVCMYAYTTRAFNKWCIKILCSKHNSLQHKLCFLPRLRVYFTWGFQKIWKSYTKWTSVAPPLTTWILYPNWCFWMVERNAESKKFIFLSSFKFKTGHFKNLPVDSKLITRKLFNMSTRFVVTPFLNLFYYVM